MMAFITVGEFIMRRFLTLLCLATGTALANPPDIDFRGVELGTPLSTFRTLPPLPTKPTLTLNSPPPVTLVCTDEPAPPYGAPFAYVSEWERPLSAVRCGYLQKLAAYPDIHAKPGFRYVVAALDVAGVAVPKYDFLFLKLPTDAEPVLAEISLSVPPEGVEHVWNALQAKFGPSTVPSLPSNELGWFGKNGDHLVSARRRADNLQVNYASYRTMMKVGDLLREHQKANAGL